MNIPVLLEPTATGFRASTGAPLNLSAEAPTADLALAGVRGAIQAKLATGAKIVELDVPSTTREQELIAKMASNPMFDEWVAAMKEYRRESEEEDAEATAGIENAGGPVPAPTRQEPAA
jgi:hypothetical protein